MFNFIIQISMVLSLSVIIYLLARVVPRIDDGGEARPNLINRFDRIVSRVPMTKIDRMLNAFFEKLLRKIKVVIMKVDNLINMYINRLKKNGKSRDLSENSFFPTRPDSKSIDNGKEF